jgi:hypothetical protein
MKVKVKANVTIVEVGHVVPPFVVVGLAGCPSRCLGFLRELRRANLCRHEGTPALVPGLVQYRCPGAVRERTNH